MNGITKEGPPPRGPMMAYELLHFPWKRGSENRSRWLADRAARGPFSETGVRKIFTPIPHGIARYRGFEMKIARRPPSEFAVGRDGHLGGIPKRIAGNPLQSAGAVCRPMRRRIQP